MTPLELFFDLVWELATGLLWIAGIFADGDARLAIWAIAVLVIYGGVLTRRSDCGQRVLLGVATADTAPGRRPLRFLSGHRSLRERPAARSLRVSDGEFEIS